MAELTPLLTGNISLISERVMLFMGTPAVILQCAHVLFFRYEVLPPLFNGQNNTSNGNGNGKEESSQTNGDAMVVDGDSVARAAGTHACTTVDYSFIL